MLCLCTVNAICLGLGGDPKFLARASSLSDFVRHTAQMATIEIELKGNGMNNVVRREFGHLTRTSRWVINGREVHDDLDTSTLFHVL